MARSGAAQDGTIMLGSIAEAWETAGGRVRARKMLDELTLVWLVALEKIARQRELRQECASRLAMIGADADAVDRAVLDAAYGSTDRVLLDARSQRLVAAMVDARPLLLDTARRFAGTGALLCHFADRDEPELLDGNTVTSSRVIVVHPVTLDDARLGALRARRLEQPIDQLERRLFRVAPHQERELALVLPETATRDTAALWARGWIPDDTMTVQLGDDDVHVLESYRDGPEGVRAHWNHVEREVRFTRLSGATIRSRRVTLPLGDVPAVNFSETLHDLLPKPKTRRVPKTTPRIHVTPLDNTDLVTSMLHHIAERPEVRLDAMRAVHALGPRAARVADALSRNARDLEPGGEEVLPAIEAALTNVLRRY